MDFHSPGCTCLTDPIALGDIHEPDMLTQEGKENTKKWFSHPTERRDAASVIIGFVEVTSRLWQLARTQPAHSTKPPAGQASSCWGGPTWN